MSSMWALSAAALSAAAPSSVSSSAEVRCTTVAGAGEVVARARATTASCPVGCDGVGGRGRGRHEPGSGARRTVVAASPPATCGVPTAGRRSATLAGATGALGAAIMRGSNERATWEEPAKATRRGSTTWRGSLLPGCPGVAGTAARTTGKGGAEGAPRLGPPTRWAAPASGNAWPACVGEAEPVCVCVAIVAPLPVTTVTGARSCPAAGPFGCVVDPPVCSPAKERGTGGAAPALCTGAAGRIELDGAVPSTGETGRGCGRAGRCSTGATSGVVAATRSDSPRRGSCGEPGEALVALPTAGLLRAAALSAGAAGLFGPSPCRGRPIPSATRGAIGGVAPGDAGVEGAAAVPPSMGTGPSGYTIGTAAGSAARPHRRWCCATSGSIASKAAYLASPRAATDRAMTPGRRARPARRARSTWSQGPSSPWMPGWVTVASPHR